MALGKWLRKYVNDEVKDKVRHAVIKAETTTNVEIIPVVKGSCTKVLPPLIYLYCLRVLISSLPSIVLSFFTLSICTYYFNLWIDPNYIILSSFLLYYIVFYYLFWHSPFPVLPKGLYQVFATAIVKQEFYENKCEETQKNPSLMMYAFLREHIFMVYGDRVLFETIDEDLWDDLIQNFVRHMKDEKLCEAFETSIAMATKYLKNEFPKTDCNTNETKDDLRIR